MSVLVTILPKYWVRDDLHKRCASSVKVYEGVERVGVVYRFAAILARLAGKQKRVAAAHSF